jgi:hypothetical protein
LGVCGSEPQISLMKWAALPDQVIMNRHPNLTDAVRETEFRLSLLQLCFAGEAPSQTVEEMKQFLGLASEKLVSTQ